MLLQSRLLSAFGEIRHGFFTREGGVSTGLYASLNGGVGSNDEREHVVENRSRMAAALGCAPRNLLTAYQIHSPDVVVAATPWPADERPRADAIVTRVPSLAIGVSTADCGPLLFADVDARVIGAAHSGWRGALTGVLEATVDVMEQFGAQRRRIIAALGPMIRQENYEVGEDLIQRFADADPPSKRFFAPAARSGHAMFDLAGYIVARLARARVECEDLGVCTYADEKRFYSFRRATHRGEPDYGRHINAIMLV
ncbi:MAG TPA: peptidoglycan editing factor PgeF [Xanthobacteraceae bacterium]|nr:peptidoglycan editing factor PgeF [Xanthobacteraceae bacterium]